MDLLTIVGHKLYAPKGIGALYVRSGTVLDSLVHGAGHEGGRRAGTENVPYMVALGAACALAGRAARIRRRRARAEASGTACTRSCEDGVPGLALNGHPERRLPNTLNVSFPGLDGEELLARTPGDRGLDGLGLPRRPDRAVRRPAGDGHRPRRGRSAPSGSRSATRPPAEEVEAAASALIESARVAVGSR